MMRARAGTAAYGILRSRFKPKACPSDTNPLRKGWSGHIFGIPVFCDPDMPADLIELRDDSGALMGQVTNIGTKK